MAQFKSSELIFSWKTSTGLCPLVPSPPAPPPPMSHCLSPVGHSDLRCCFPERRRNTCQTRLFPLPAFVPLLQDAAAEAEGPCVPPVSSGKEGGPLGCPWVQCPSPDGWHLMGWCPWRGGVNGRTLSGTGAAGGGVSPDGCCHAGWDHGDGVSERMLPHGW